MPGLTFMIAAEGRTDDNCDAGKAQALLLHSPDYKAHSAAEKPGLHLGWVAYDGYPVRVFSSAGCQIYLEGRIYNRPAASVEADLAALAETALGPERDDAGVERFILSNEGAYLVAIVRPETHEVLVFSDPFSRLPLYYSAEESRLIVAREAKFVHALRLAPAFDRVGCAQVLAFGLPLGDRTVLEGVKSFPDAGLLRAELVAGRLRWRLRTLSTWNLDEEEAPGLSLGRRTNLRTSSSPLPQLGLARRQPGQPCLAQWWPRFTGGGRRTVARRHWRHCRYLSRSERQAGRRSPLRPTTGGSAGDRMALHRPAPAGRVGLRGTGLAERWHELELYGIHPELPGGDRLPLGAGPDVFFRRRRRRLPQGHSTQAPLPAGRGCRPIYPGKGDLHSAGAGRGGFEAARRHTARGTAEAFRKLPRAGFGSTDQTLQNLRARQALLLRG